MSPTARPRVSVVMAVYNGGGHLEQSLESILRQSFEDFECIVVDDGSTDDTYDIVRSYDDPRIVPVKNEANLGLTPSLNIGIRKARGRYVARMDADDFSYKKRLELQVAAMDADEDLGVLGTGYTRVSGDKTSRHGLPPKDRRIRVRHLWGGCIIHPSAMIRADIFTKYGQYYDESFTCSQDYELWQRVALNTPYRFGNLKDNLLRYSVNPDQISTRRRSEQERLGDIVRTRHLARMNIEADAESLAVHKALNDPWGDHGTPLKHVVIWSNFLMQANKKTGYVNPEVLKDVVTVKLGQHIKRHKEQGTYEDIPMHGEG